MSDPIDPAIVEVAAKAVDWETHRFRVDSDKWVPFCGCGWKTSTPYATAEFDRHLAELALEAAAPAIAAKALRDAADGYQTGGWADDLPTGGSRPALILGMSQRAIAWLRARADDLEAGQS